MKHLFIPYELAVIAKEKGFTEECFGYYYYSHKKGIWNITYPQTVFKQWYTGKEVCAPLYQQIVDWFREEHKLDINPKLHWTSNSTGVYKYFVSILDLRIKYEGEPNSSDQLSNDSTKYEYNKALNKAIEESFKLIP